MNIGKVRRDRSEKCRERVRERGRRICLIDVKCVASLRLYTHSCDVQPTIQRRSRLIEEGTLACARDSLSQSARTHTHAHASIRLRTYMRTYLLRVELVWVV